MKAAPAPVNPLASVGHEGHVVHMTAKDHMAEKDREREERLAAALRENLKRRKAQARTKREAAKNKNE
jgi:hypothetical protein